MHESLMGLWVLTGCVSMVAFLGVGIVEALL
jgi:hypothetical protein